MDATLAAKSPHNYLKQTRLLEKGNVNKFLQLSESKILQQPEKKL